MWVFTFTAPPSTCHKPSGQWLLAIVINTDGKYRLVSADRSNTKDPNLLSSTVQNGDFRKISGGKNQSLERQYGSVSKGLAMQTGNPCSIAKTYINMDGMNWLQASDVAYSPSTGDTEAGSSASLVYRYRGTQQSRALVGLELTTKTNLAYNSSGFSVVRTEAEALSLTPH